MLLTPGPVDRDFVEGELTNWHIDALNTSDGRIYVVFTVYALYGLFPHPIPIGTVSVDLEAGEYGYLTMEVNKKYEHTLPVIEIPNDEVLLTLYGRNIADKQLCGAVYPKKLLVKLNKPLHKECEEEV